VTAIPAQESGGEPGTGNTGNLSSAGTGNVSGEGGAAGAVDPPAGGLGGEGGAEVRPWEAPALYQASFAAYALPGEYVRHQNAQGFVTPIDPTTVDAVDATFEVVEGLIGDCFSIRRLGGEYNYMRHSGSRIWFNFAEAEPLYYADATFCFEPGLAEPTWVSLRSYNYPNRYIRIQNGDELWIATDDGTPEFAAAATFRIENPFQQPD
jgi:hypothetical protein